MFHELADHASPTTAGTLRDEDIVARVLAGETALFELLMRRHNPRIFRTVRAILRHDEECEDVMQQTYISAFLHLGQFHGSARFSTWLTRIAINEALRQGRSATRDLAPATDQRTEETASSPSPEHVAYARELAAILELAVDTLPLPYRLVFALREIEGLSTAETAASLEINEETVKTRLHRAKVRLRAHLVQRLGTTPPQIYALHLSRCDRVVAGVLAQLAERHCPS
jgi:RNA polymerase sigma-70 factor, ECF subfamily